MTASSIYFSARQRALQLRARSDARPLADLALRPQTGETLPLTTGFGGAARPAISPDGKTLAFVSRRDADTVLVARDLGAAPSGSFCAA